MSERRDIIPVPGPSKRKVPDSDAFSEFSPIKKPRPDGDPTPPDEDPHGSRAMPRRSYLLIAPEEGHNVPRTLINEEANPVNPILFLADTFEAAVVLDCPKFIVVVTKFRVYDVHNTRYDMQLLRLRKIGGLIQLFFNLGWTDFVKDHNLGAGDQILFKKNLDTTISADFFYILKYVKNPDSSKKLGDGAESSTKLSDDGAESSTKPGGSAESSRKLSDGAESSEKPGDGAESHKYPGDRTESSKKLGDGAESSRKPGDGAESSRKPGDGAESSRKPGGGSESSTKLSDDGAESSTILSDDSDQSVLGIGMPVFKIIYLQVLLEKPTDQEQINAPKPGSRPFQLEALCFSKTLTQAELSRWLFFDVYDAIILTDNPSVAEILPGFSQVFLIYDREDRPYRMTLRHLELQGGIFGFFLDGWDEVVKNYDLKRGDRVAFYKFLDRRIRYCYYYVVVKLPEDVDCENTRNPIRPGSRELMPGGHCFSKILSTDDVSSEVAGLQLEAQQASYFESSSRSLNELFMVYDGDDRKYHMKLSYYFKDQVVMCFLDIADWHYFVLNNELRAGDTIYVNKIFDQSVCADHYFIFTFTRA